MAVRLLTDEFWLDPNGSVPAADTGQVWVPTGTSEITIQSGACALSSGTNGYLTTSVDPYHTVYSALFVFPSGAGLQELTLIGHNEDSFQGLDMGMHFVMSTTNLIYHVRENGGAFEPIISQTFTNPLSRDTLLSCSVTFADNGTVTIVGPDSVTYVATNESRLDTLRGKGFVIQCLRDYTTSPNPYWLATYIDGNLAPVGVAGGTAYDSPAVTSGVPYDYPAVTAGVPYDNQ